MEIEQTGQLSCDSTLAEATLASKELVIVAAITGSRYLKTSSALAPGGVPAIPYSVDEAVEAAARCYEAGARLVHVHSRAMDGAHTCDPVWYEEFAARVRAICPGLKVCFATSRAGEVTKEIESLSAEDGSMTPVVAEIHARTKYLNRVFPDLLTSFSATEVAMAGSAHDIGHVHGPAKAEIARQFFEGLSRITRENAIGQEIEITSPRTMDLIEELDREGLLHGPLHFVILPNFTAEFGFDSSALELIAERAMRIVKSHDDAGLISLGVVLNPVSGSGLEARLNLVRFALRNPNIEGIRVGIEDGPYWDGQPSTNEELVQRTAHTIRENGGLVSLDTALFERSEPRRHNG